MRLAIIVLAVLGLLAAGSAAVVVQTMKLRVGVPVAEVLVAQMDLPASTCLVAENVKRESIPTPALPHGCLLDPSQAIGRYLIAPLLKGQVVTESCLVARGSLAEKLYTLPPGMTVATVAVPSRSINDSLLYSGCYVDVLASLREGAGSDARFVSGTLFKMIQVWGTGDDAGGLAPSSQDQQKAKGKSAGAGGTIKVHLLATEEQTEILQMVGERGTITLTVRNPREVTPSGLQAELVADENLRRALGLMPEPPVTIALAEPAPGPADMNEVDPLPLKPPRIVEVILGQKVTEQKFPPKDDESGRNQ